MTMISLEEHLRRAGIAEGSQITAMRKFGAKAQLTGTYAGVMPLGGNGKEYPAIQVDGAKNVVSVIAETIMPVTPPRLYIDNNDDKVYITSLEANPPSCISRYSLKNQFGEFLPVDADINKSDYRQGLSWPGYVEEVDRRYGRDISDFPPTDYAETPEVLIVTEEPELTPEQERLVAEAIHNNRSIQVGDIVTKETIASEGLIEGNTVTVETKATGLHPIKPTRWQRRHMKYEKAPKHKKPAPVIDAPKPAANRKNVYFQTTEKGIVIRVQPAGNNPVRVDLRDKIAKAAPGAFVGFNDPNPFGPVVMDAIRAEVKSNYSGLRLFSSQSVCTGNLFK